MEALSKYARWSSVLLLISFLFACGGGGSNSSSDSTSTDTNGKQLNVVTGTITSVPNSDTIRINGRSYGIASATITRSGSVANISDLNVGVVVNAAVIAAPNEATLSLSDIAIQTLITGEVTGINTAARTINVLGMSVRYTQTTIFQGVDPLALMPSNIISISGFQKGQGQIVATRIALVATSFVANETILELAGSVSNLDSGNASFSLGNLTVSYGSVDAIPGNLTNGASIIVSSGNQLAGDILSASSIFIDDSNPVSPPATTGSGSVGLPQAINFEGIVQTVTNGQLQVNGVTVILTPGTTIVNGSASSISVNDIVRVNGSLDANGALAASSITLTPSAQVIVEGSVDNISANASTVTVLGITFNINDSTILNSDASDSNTFSVNDITTENQVRIVAFASGQGNTFVATGLKVLEQIASDQVELAGPLDGVNEPDFSVAGTMVITDADTEFVVIDAAGELVGENATDFFSNAQPGEMVEVEGEAIDAGNILAKEVVLALGGGGGGVPTPNPPTAPAGNPVMAAGPITAAVDPATNMFNIFDITMHIMPNARITNAATGATLAPADLMIDDPVRISGIQAADGIIHLDSIEVQAAPLTVIGINGPTEAIDATAQTVTIFGITIQTDTSTQFLDATGATITATTFFSTAKVPDAIHVRGTPVVGTPLTLLAINVDIVPPMPNPPAPNPPVPNPPVPNPPVPNPPAPKPPAPNPPAPNPPAPNPPAPNPPAPNPPVPNPPAPNPPVPNPPAPNPPVLTGDSVMGAGPITVVVDSVTNILSMFDIPMHVMPTTVITNAGTGATLTPADIMLNDPVRISAIMSADGIIHLETVEVQAAPLAIVGLNGPTDAIDVTAQTVTMLGITVQTNTTTTYADMNGTTVTAAEFFASITSPIAVHVRGAPVAATPMTLLAESIDASIVVSHGHSVSIAGAITTIVNPTTMVMEVFGSPMHVMPNATITNAGAPGVPLLPVDLMLDDPVRISGTFLDTVFHATTIEVQTAPLTTIDVSGPASLVNAAQETLMVLGLNVRTDANTLYTDQAGAALTAAEFFGTTPDHTIVNVLGGMPVTGAPGNIVAGTIEVGTISAHNHHVSLIAPITVAFDATTNAISVFDTVMNITPMTTITDAASGATRTTADLVLDVPVQAIGVLMPDGVIGLESVAIQATPLAGYLVHSPIDTINATAQSYVTRLGVTVQTDAGTTFLDINDTPITATDFFTNFPPNASAHARNATVVAGTPMTLLAGIVKSDIILPTSSAVAISAPVTAAVNATTMMFDVFGVTMHIMPNTAISDAVTGNPLMPADLAIDTPVITTSVIDNGVIHVATIEVQAAPLANLDVSGSAEVIDGATNTITLLGLTVITDANTTFTDAAGAMLTQANFFATIPAMTALQVVGTPDTATPTSLLASTVMVLP